MNDYPAYSAVNNMILGNIHCNILIIILQGKLFYLRQGMFFYVAHTMYFCLKEHVLLCHSILCQCGIQVVPNIHRTASATANTASCRNFQGCLLDDICPVGVCHGQYDTIQCSPTCVCVCIYVCVARCPFYSPLRRLKLMEKVQLYCDGLQSCPSFFVYV